MADATFEVNKYKAIKGLNDLLAESNKCADQAQALAELAEEENRDMTEEERTAFDALLEDSRALKAQYDAELLADQRAARRAALEEIRGSITRTPSAMQVMSRGALSRVTHLHDRILDDPKRGFASVGEFFMTVQQAHTPGQAMIDDRLQRIAAAASGLNQTQGSQGGYLVPPSFSQMIWDGMNEMPDNLMQYCDVHQVTGESLTFNANGETSRATGSRFGGVRAYWINEADEKTASSPRFRRMTLEPQELAVLIYATDKLLRNAPALDSYIRRAAGEEIMWMVNDAIINGTGAGQPLGIMNSGALIEVAKTGNQPADTIEFDNINAMYGRLLSRARSGAAWYVNQDIEPALETLTFNAGLGGYPIYLPSSGGFPTATDAPNARLKGLPVRPAEYMKTLGDKGDILLANLQYYALGVAGGIEEAMSIHVRFIYDETAFRFVFRVDGQPWVNTPLTPANGSNTLSPFVTLAARA
jgi:HK97 family phage major capsid protein